MVDHQCPKTNCDRPTIISDLGEFGDDGLIYTLGTRVVGVVWEGGSRTCITAQRSLRYILPSQISQPKLRVITSR